MTIYQQELMRKLSQYGCNGSYSENEETLSFSYNGIKIGWMKKNGSICGVVDVNMPDEVDNMFFIIQKQAKEICEYVRLRWVFPMPTSIANLPNIGILFLLECTANSTDSCLPHGVKAQIRATSQTAIIPLITPM